MLYGCYLDVVDCLSSLLQVTLIGLIWCILSKSEFGHRRLLCRLSSTLYYLYLYIFYIQNLSSIFVQKCPNFSPSEMLFSKIFRHFIIISYIRLPYHTDKVKLICSRSFHAFFNVVLGVSQLLCVSRWLGIDQNKLLFCMFIVALNLLVHKILS